MMFDQLLKQNEEMLKSMQSIMNLDAFEKAMKPMTDLLELQRSMLESLAEEQTQLSTEMMADALEEARAVCQCESMHELMEVHKKFLQKYQEKMAELAKKQASSWTQVSEETLNLVKKNTEEMAKSFKK
jgi:phasin family protein